MKRIALFFAAVAGLLLAVPSPALAHNSLVEAQPAKDATLEKAPAEVRLRFLASLDKKTTLTVTDAAGGSAIGAVTIDGKVISAPFTATGGGKFTVTYALISADGHPVNSSYGFSVAAPPEPVTKTVPSLEPTPSPSETQAPVAAAPTTPASNDTPWFPYIGGAIVAGLAVGALLAYLKRRRNPTP